MHKAQECEAIGIRVAMSHSLVVDGKKDSSLTLHWEPGKAGTDYSLKKRDITMVGQEGRRTSGKTR